MGAINFHSGPGFEIPSGPHGPNMPGCPGRACIAGDLLASIAQFTPWLLAEIRRFGVDRFGIYRYKILFIRCFT